MRDAFGKFQSNDIALYALSYDDQATLAEFAQKQNVPYPLLSDVDSEVIRRYGLLNTEVSPDDVFLYGIPFPGVFVCNEDGRVVAKFFHESYKKRDSAEALIDAALGHIEIDDSAPVVSNQPETDDIRITAAVHGGAGTVRQGVVRKLVVRFELAPGLHIYSEPVPNGMVATSVTVSGPEGFRTHPVETPATSELHLAAMDVTLNVWSGTVDMVIPFYATGELASETRPLDQDSIDIAINVRYQACTDNECLLPRTEQLSLNLKLDVIDTPALKIHMGHGQREGSFDSTPALRRLLWRKIKERPSGVPKFIWKMIKLNWAARQRAKQ